MRTTSLFLLCSFSVAILLVRVTMALPCTALGVSSFQLTES